jgi:transposase
MGSELQGRLIVQICRLALLLSQRQELEDEHHRLISLEQTREMQIVCQLLGCKDFDPICSWLLMNEELLWKNFSNRREVASFVGMMSTPIQNGDSAKEQSIC